MSLALQLALIALSVGGLLAAMAGVRLLADRHGWSAELQRKTVHVTTGLYALTLPLTFKETWPVLLLCTLSIAVMGIMRLPVFANSGIGSTIHGVERKSYGEILLAVAVGFTFFRSLGEPVLYVLPILVLTFSDAAAAMVGVRYGQRRFEVEDGVKSLEGVVMFFLVTVILAMSVLLLMTEIARPSVILLAVLIAAFGAQIEAESWRGFDNLFVPVGLHLFLQNNLDLAPLALLAETIGFLALIGLLIHYAPALGLTRHAARGYGVLAFLILSVTAPYNAILPLCAFAAFVMLRRVRPCHSPYPDLDFLAATAGVAALWLFLGEVSGHNTINLYNLTFAGAAAVFVTIALADRLPPALGLVAALAAAAITIAPLNPQSATWSVAFAVATVASLALAALIALMYPHRFDRYRSPRVFAVALVVPLLLFLAKVLSP